MEALAGILGVAVLVLVGAVVYLLTRGGGQLDAKKQLIDARLAEIGSKLERVTSAVEGVDSRLTTQLRTFGEQTAALTTSTESLRSVLANSRARGQWGERMAEDILRAIGLVEGVNYRKQPTLPGARGRPDFVFSLPGDLRLNMDVKFPFDNYQRFIEAESSAAREMHEKAFLRDVRDRIKEIATREYIDPEGGTVDYALLFVPNESVYAFICERDSTVLDYSLSVRVVCCSPHMLFAMLALVDQAARTLGIRKASEEIVSLMGRFNAEWRRFGDSLEALGKRLASSERAYDELIGPRKRRLERSLDAIDALRTERGLPIAPIFPEEQASLLPDDALFALTSVDDQE